MATTKVPDTVTVPFGQIVVDPEIGNIRALDRQYVKALAKSIEDRGLEEPVKVMFRNVNGKAEYVLISGFHRWEAIKLIRSESKKAFAQVPVTFFRGEGSAAAREANFVSNVLRKNLSPPEVARAAYDLSVEGANLGKVAVGINYSAGRLKTMVKNWGKACDALRSAALTGQVTLDILDEIVKQTDNPQEQEVLLKRAIEALKKEKNPKSHKAKRKAKKAAGGKVRPGKREIAWALEELQDINRKYVQGFYYGLLCCLGDEDLEDAVSRLQDGEDVSFEKVFADDEAE